MVMNFPLRRIKSVEIESAREAYSVLESLNIVKAKKEGIFYIV